MNIVKFRDSDLGYKLTPRAVTGRPAWFGGVSQIGTPRKSFAENSALCGFGTGTNDTLHSRRALRNLFVRVHATLPRTHLPSPSYRPFGMKPVLREPCN